MTQSRCLECHPAGLYCSSKSLRPAQIQEEGNFLHLLMGGLEKNSWPYLIYHNSPQTMFLVFLLPDGDRGPVHAEHSIANVTFSIKLIRISCFSSFRLKKKFYNGKFQTYKNIQQIHHPVSMIISSWPILLSRPHLLFPPTPILF